MLAALLSPHPMPPGEQLIATILKHDSKSTSYKLALLRALNDIVYAHPELARQARPVAVPLRLLAERWLGYYWPFTNPDSPVYQGARAQRDGLLRNDLSFRPALTQLQQVWQQYLLQGQSPSPADGVYLVAEMQTPRRRAMYPVELQLAYDAAIRAIIPALSMPIKYAGEGHWTVFAKPARASSQSISLLPRSQDLCVEVTASIWQAFHRLSLYIEALCIHEWSLFTEQVRQDEVQTISRGAAYTLLTARPDNRRPLSWERNQVDVLLFENKTFTCPWTQKVLSTPAQYDLDHLLPLSLFPINELWNLLPVDRQFNQRIKRDRVPSAERLSSAQPLLAQAYAQYQQSTALSDALRQDTGRRFPGILPGSLFPTHLAQHAVRFMEDLAMARLANRF